MRYVDGHPPGTIAIVSADLSRYPDFHISMLRTKVPTGSTVDWGRGAGIAGNLNAITRRALERGHHWVWYMGDDHVWDPDLLIHLLSRDVGVVAPICAHRLPPYMPHIYKAVPNDTLFEVGTWEDCPLAGMDKRDGLGTAGMLIRREVLEQIPQPWFEVGKTAPDALGEDLWLCKKMNDLGIPIHVDTDHTLGHISTVIVWPLPGRGVRLECGSSFSVDLDISTTTPQAEDPTPEVA